MYIYYGKHVFQSKFDSFLNILIHFCREWAFLKFAIFFQTQQTSYASQYVKECKTHYKKACWVDMQDIFTTKTVTICTTRPENKCQRSIETGQNEKKICKPFHETGEIRDLELRAQYR